MASPAAYHFLVIVASRHIVNLDPASISTIVVVLNISADTASMLANVCVGRLDLFGGAITAFGSGDEDTTAITGAVCPAVACTTAPNDTRSMSALCVSKTASQGKKEILKKERIEQIETHDVLKT